MDNAKSLNDDYFIKNAILCWLHHYPNHKWTAIYKELAERDSYLSQSQPEVVSKPVSRRKAQGRNKTTKPVES